MRAKERCFKEFYSKQFATSATFCTQFLNDRALGEDIAQEAFLRLWRKINEEEYDIRNLQAFLYTTCRNLCYDYIRTHAVVLETITPETINILTDGDLLLDEITRLETVRLIREAIHQLSGRKLDIILLSLSGKSNQEIADALNISINTVKTLKKDAYSQLRILLKDEILLLFIVFGCLNSSN